MENKFELSHVVLYAKGWYHSTDNIFRDLRFALTLDGYSGEFFKDLEIIYKLLSECENLNHRNEFKLSTIYSEIQPCNTFKFGYVHNQTPDIFRNENDDQKKYEKCYDFNLAILYYILSSLKFLHKDNWNQVKPIYGKGLSKPKDVTNKQFDEMFNAIDK